MKTLTKKVYYCDFCRKHGLSRAAMEKHERHCTLNPSRVCRWVIDGEHHHVVLVPLIAQLQEIAPLDEDAINWLREEAHGCPACMLAALRQSDLEYHYAPDHGRLWDYTEEVARFRKDEQEDAYRSEVASIEAGWL